MIIQENLKVEVFIDFRSEFIPANYRDLSNVQQNIEKC